MDDENEELYDNEDNDDDQSSNSESTSQGDPNGSSLRDRASNGINKVKGLKDKGRQAGQAVSNAFKKIVDGVKVAAKFIISHPIVAIGIAVVIIIILAALWLATEMLELKEAVTNIKDFFTNTDESSMSTNEKKAKDLYESTGSLIYVTDDQLNKFTDDYLDWLENKNDVKYEALKRKYKKGDPTASFPSGVADINESEKLYKHILSAEKYNFNRINWQAYTRDNLLHNEEPSGDLDMQKDAETKLQYPKYLGDLGGVSELDFYVNKVFPYLQSWVIPISMMGGTTEGGMSGLSEEDDSKTLAADAYNARFAYEIIASGYHKIDFDRYETYMREIIEEYRSYDETITQGTVTRTCTTYKREVPAPTEEDPGRTVTETAGPVCIDSDITYGSGTTTPIVEYPTSYSGELASGYYNIEKYVNDTYGSSYTKKTNGSLLVNDLGNTTIYQYDITKFRGFDFKFDKEYALEPYDIKLQQISANETSTPYNVEKVYNGTSPTGSEYIKKNDLPPAWVSEATTTVSTSNVNVTKKAQNGETIDVDRTWQDNLAMTSSDSGSYTVDDLKTFVGTTDLSSYEERVYNEIVEEEKLNIIDIINAKPDIYKKYLDKDQNISQYIGYSRDYLEVSYYLLKENLIDLSEEYGISYMWGSSLVPGMGMNIMGNGMEGMASLNVSGLDLIYPFTADIIKSGNLSQSDQPYGGGSYGYPNHTGIDITWGYSAVDKNVIKKCVDMGYSSVAGPSGGANRLNYCWLLKGPPVYTVMTGKLIKVSYSECRFYEGQYDGNCTDTSMSTYINDPNKGNLEVLPKGGTAVYIQNDDGSKEVYYHLYPNYEFYKELATHIGETIPIGTIVGYMGNTGSSTGLHLHFEYGTILFNGQKNGSKTLVLLNKGKQNTLGTNLNPTLNPNTNPGGGDTALPKGSMATYINAAEQFYSSGGLNGLSPKGLTAGQTYRDRSAQKEGVDYAISHYKTSIVKYCEMYNVNPAYMVSVMAMESNGGRHTGWSGSACGPMQIENVHLNSYMSAKNVLTGNTDKILVTNTNILNVDTNIQLGVMMFAGKLKNTGGNPVISAQGYNYGNTSFINGGYGLPGYCARTGKNKAAVFNDYSDVGWLYDIMHYNTNSSQAGAGNPFYAYEFMLTVEYAETKI